MKLQLLLLPVVLALFLESAEGAQVEVGASGAQKGRWKKKSKKAKDDGYKLDDPAADHTKKGIELDTAGDKDAAILSFGAAAEFDESPSTLMNFGVSLLRVARIEEARVAMDKALVLAPGDASILKNIEALEGAEKEMAGKGGGVKAPPGLSKKGKGKGAGKKNKYQRPGGGAGKKNKYKRPGSGAAKGPPSMTVNVDGYDVKDPNGDHTAQAIKFDGQGKKAESILAFEAAAKFSPGQTTHMNYAVSLMRSRQYKKALAAMEEAVKLSPNEGQVKDNMAALTQSISVDDGSPEAVALRKEHPGRFDVAKKAGKRKKKYQ